VARRGAERQMSYYFADNDLTDLQRLVGVAVTPKPTRRPTLGHGGMSAEAVGKVLGMSASRVKQVEAAALAKLRRLADSMGLTADDF
jgi:DNA-directed RNA polymerase sigma subunit (sigma70/sigma32)